MVQLTVQPKQKQENNKGNLPWFGDVPHHWKLGRISYKYEVQLGKMLQPEPRDAQDELKPYLRSANLTWKGVRFDDVKEMWFNRSELEKYGLQSGDVLVSEGGDVGRSTYWSHDTEMYIQNAVLRLRTLDSTESLPKFIYYWMYFLKHHGLINIVCNTITIAHYTAEKVKATILVYPPFEKQRSIVAFLDMKVSQIDRLITKKEELLRLLDEKRTAIITEAVTKGIDPDVEMKDSGVPWLGEVPEHWEVWKTTHGFHHIGSGTTPKSDEKDFYHGDIPWITTSELREKIITDTRAKVSRIALQEYTALKIYPAGSVAIAMYGATIGRLGILGLRATVNQACCVFSEPTEFVSRFFYYWLWMRRPVLTSLSVGGGQPNLSQDDLKQLRVPLPSKHEQQEIADYLDQKLSALESAQQKIEVSIKQLQEYSSALVTSAVTGKLNLDNHSSKHA